MKFIIIENYIIFIKEMFFLIPQRPLESSKNVSTIASIEKQDTRVLLRLCSGF